MEEIESDSNKSRSRSRPHPKVNLPFYRNSRRKKTIHNRNKNDESLNESSTQETENTLKNPGSRRYLKREFIPPYATKLDTSALNIVMSPQNRFTSINNLDFFNENQRMKETTKRNLFSNFSNSEIIQDNSHRVNLGHESHRIGNLEQINDMKVNIQRFLIKNVPVEPQNVAVKSFMDSDRNFTFQKKNPSQSVPKQRKFNRVAEIVSMINKYEQPRFKAKLKINTNNLKANVKEDFEFFHQERRNHNYSVINSPTYDIEEIDHKHNRSLHASNLTIEPHTASIKSESFKLPSLSTRNKKRRDMISNSSARKKLPQCFLMNESRSTRSRASEKNDRDPYTVSTLAYLLNQ